jgi:phosphatidylserine synthase
VKVALQTGEDSDSTRSLLVALVMILVVLVTQLIVHTHNFVEIKSITWTIRMEAAEPFQFSLTIPRILSLENYWPLYLFVFVVHRLYVGKTSFRRVLLTGLFSGIYLPIVGNL